MASPDLKDILLAEDNANDVELTLTALQKHNIANQVIVVRDGAQALDYLFRRGSSPTGAEAIPPSSCSISRCPKSMDWRCCAALNPTTNSGPFPS